MGKVIQVCDQSQLQPTIALIFYSSLRQIGDKGKRLYDRINAQDREECQDDIQAVSEIAEDIRDAVLDYQVGRDITRLAVVSLKLGYFDR